MGNDIGRDDGALSQWIGRNITPLITLATFVTIVFSGFLWIEDHYATAQDFAQLEQRFEIKIKSDSLREINSRRWQLQDRLENNPNDLTAKEDLRNLDTQKRQIERELDALENIKID